jgi:hypothetical protein
LAALFGLTLLVSAALLFVIQPMIAKMVLPLLGGSPAVWNTCMLFFQAALLAGYAYAHSTTTWLRTRSQAALHAGLLFLPLFFLPLGIPEAWARSLPTGSDPSPWLLGLLLAIVGLPFFLVSTTAPLLQRWFSTTGHPAAADPYFLYGASNVGSMVALLAYPLVVEPNLRLTRQCEIWTAGYIVLMVLILACGAIVWRARGDTAKGPEELVDVASADRPGLGQWCHWIALAFVPSSLMLGVTTYLTTDITPIPLLWVIPLALYLLTFILVFARRPPLPHRWMVHTLPIVVAVLTLIMCLNAAHPALIVVHLLAFFIAAMVCHGELVRLRPRARHLTAFYLAMSVGGVLGGVFNALVAPLVFTWVAEYPLALVLACVALPGAGFRTGKPRDRVLDIFIPVVLGVLVAGLAMRFRPLSASRSGALGPKLFFGLAVFACYTLKNRPVRFALGIGAVLLASHLSDTRFGRVLRQERNFYGVVRVTQDDQGHFRRMIHGNTNHGQQSLDPHRRGDPLTYYHRTGPVGQILEVFCARPARPEVGVVGLGTGSLACYAEPGQRWTFFEIDPAVVKFARDPGLFTYLKDCRAQSLEFTVGDARIRLRDEPEHRYGLIVLDAFSSDAIPIHLLTREALRLYRGKLAPGGMLAFHISNLYIDLPPVLGALASDAGLITRLRSDLDLTKDQVAEGKLGSIWAVMVAREQDLGALAQDPRWKAPALRRDNAVWTDDFTDIVRHFIIRKM